MSEHTPRQWIPIEQDLRQTERIVSQPTTYMQDVLYRFSRKKTAVASMIAVILMVLIALFGPILSGKTYDAQVLSHVNIAPYFTTYEVGGSYLLVTNNQKVLTVAPDGTLLTPLRQVSDDTKNKRQVYELNGETFYLNYRVNPAPLVDENGAELTAKKGFFNKLYPLGSDGLGRDISVRLLYGMRISLIVAFVATAVNLLIGVLYGSLSGYVGGMLDNVMMRTVDIISAIPLTLYVILIMVMFTNNAGFTSIIIALGSVYWVGMARVVRSQILSLKEQEFIAASKTMGSRTWYILRKHLIPNAVGPITVTATMQIPSAIFTEAFMSFIGLGITAPMASLGTMCNDALDTLRTAPYQLVLPAAVICLIMFAFNFIGDGLRDAFDPNMRV